MQTVLYDLINSIAALIIGAGVWLGLTFAFILFLILAPKIGQLLNRFSFQKR